jgi:secreted trypsin-like serine protease
VLLGSSFIYGGMTTAHGAWPWIVVINKQLDETIKYVCGASLLSNKVVISAAHCIKPFSVNQIILYIGAYDISNKTNNDYEVRKPSELIVHPDYSTNKKKETADADIGLLIMQKPVQFNSFIRPICLWPSQLINEDVVDQTGIIVGWGRSNDNAFSTATPLSIELPIVSDGTCLREDISYFYITSNRTFCVGEKNRKGLCHGDSGSGFFMKRNDKWLLRGIVSTGIADPGHLTCNLEKYVVMSDVVKYQDWIMSYL